jgi:lysophospholipase L1-like esterase
MKTALLVLITGVIAVVTFLAGEGLYAIALGDRPSRSLSYQIYDLIGSRPNTSADTPSGIRADVINDEREFKSLLEDFKEDGVGLGNTPYEVLRTEKAAMNYDEDGCLRQKPNADKTSNFLRTTLFDPFNPPNAFYDTDEELTPGVSEFLEKYGMQRISYRTNPFGERLTLPEVSRARKVLIAGDSVANGAGVSNDETIASRLQQRDGTLQYVNIAVNGSNGSDIICNLMRAGERYRGHIEKLIFVYCENDFKPDRPFGKPDEVVKWLQEFAREQGIAEVVIVFAPYIYNVFPEVARIKGIRGWEHNDFSVEKEWLETLTDDAGFTWVDIGDLGREELERGKSIFAGLSLYVDSVHLSPKGSERVAERILGG